MPINRVYKGFRNQLGSIRKVYWRGNKIHRNNDFANFPETVLLLHGFFQTRNIWEIMESRLRRDGYGVLSLNLGGLMWRYNTRSISTQAQNVADKMESICEKYKLDKFHIIGHSMGGLVARKYIQNHNGDKRVKSLTTLGTPHHGTPTAIVGVGLMGLGLLSVSPIQMLPRSKFLQQIQTEEFPEDLQFTSIFSNRDLVCPWWASVLRPSKSKEKNMKNFKLKGIGHSELTSHPQVYKIILDRMKKSNAKV